MLKKDLTYENLDGETVTETFYFNMTKAELIKLELSEDDGWQAKAERIGKKGTPAREIIETFEDILRRSYGVRTPDGKFTKPAGAFDEFLASEAYSQLLFDLTTDAGKAAEFFNAVMPAGLLEEARKAQNASKSSTLHREEVLPLPSTEASIAAKDNSELMTEEALWDAMGLHEDDEKDYTKLTKAELRNLPKSELQKAYRQRMAK